MYTILTGSQPEVLNPEPYDLAWGLIRGFRVSSCSEEKPETLNADP